MKRESAMIVALGALLIVAAYVAAYGGMLRPGETHIGDVIPGTGRYELQPVYRWENNTVRSLFWPAHQIDRLLFPARWSAELLVD